MNDYDIVKILRRMRKLTEKVQDLATEIEESDYPNAQALVDDLYGQCVVFASPESVGINYLMHPERWEIRNGIAIRRKKNKNGVNKK